MGAATTIDASTHVIALVAVTFLVAGFVKGVVGVGFPTISVGVNVTPSPSMAYTLRSRS